MDKNTKRLIAFCIDFILIGIFYKFLNSIIPLEFEIGEVFIFNFNLKLSFSLLVFFYFFYRVFFDLFFEGITIGKKIMKLEIVINNREVIKKRLILRSFYVLCTLLIFPISILLYLFKDKYLLQDKLSNIRVKEQSE